MSDATSDGGAREASTVDFELAETSQRPSPRGDRAVSQADGRRAACRPLSLTCRISPIPLMC